MTAVTITDGGRGYTTAPTVGFAGGGFTTPASTPTATLSITDVRIDNGGSELGQIPTKLVGVTVALWAKRSAKGNINCYLSEGRTDKVLDASEVATRMKALFGDGADTTASNAEPFAVDPAEAAEALREAADRADDAPF